MQNYVTEYRVNKKGCECFRTTDEERAKKYFFKCNLGRPYGVYTMQRRFCPVNRLGVLEEDGLGRPQWSCWMDMNG